MGVYRVQPTKELSSQTTRFTSANARTDGWFLIGTLLWATLYIELLNSSRIPASTLIARRLLSFNAFTH